MPASAMVRCRCAACRAGRPDRLVCAEDSRKVQWWYHIWALYGVTVSLQFSCAEQTHHCEHLQTSSRMEKTGCGHRSSLHRSRWGLRKKKSFPPKNILPAIVVKILALHSQQEEAWGQSKTFLERVDHGHSCRNRACYYGWGGIGRGGEVDQSRLLPDMWREIPTNAKAVCGKCLSCMAHMYCVR